MRHALELLQSVGNMKNGVNRVIDSVVRTIGARGDPNDPLHPTLIFYFVRMAEALAAYVTLYEHISSSRLLPITPSDLTTRVWDLINRKKAWKNIAKGDNVEKLFKEFHFNASQGAEEPLRRHQAGDQLPEVPRGAGPLAIRRPGGGAPRCAPGRPPPGAIPALGDAPGPRGIPDLGNAPGPGGIAALGDAPGGVAALGDAPGGVAAVAKKAAPTVAKKAAPATKQGAFRGYLASWFQRPAPKSGGPGRRGDPIDESGYYSAK
jgi:hypothetical protein